MELVRQNTKDFLDSQKKNRVLRNADKNAVCFVCTDFCGKETLETITEYLMANDDSMQEDIIIFGEGWDKEPGDEYELLSVISEIKICAIVLNKDICVRVGGFHPLFSNGTNEEWLLRAAAETTIKYIKVPVNKEGAVRAPGYYDIFAYHCAKQMLLHPEDMRFAGVLKELIVKFEKRGELSGFMEGLRAFTSDKKRLDRYINATAPILIISGDDTCYGLLKYMSSNLAKEIESLGQQVVTTDGEYKGYEGAEDFERKHWRAVIGIHSAFLYSDYIRKQIYPRFCFWFDNPLFFDHFPKRMAEEDHLLMADMKYAEYLKNYYGASNAVFMPPGGVDTGLSEKEILDAKRDLDVVFIGTYKDTDGKLDSEEEQKAYEYLLNNPGKTVEEALSIVIKDWEVMSTDKRIEKIQSMSSVQRNIANHYRRKIVEEILVSGIKINVFGKSWERYNGKNSDNLIIRDEVSPQEIPGVLLRAKISLNIMYWHKAGMTERVIQSMLCGAVCVTDETSYIRREYRNEEELIIFGLDETENLPERIKRLSENTNKRVLMAKNAYEHALEAETWRSRAEKILEMMD